MRIRVITISSMTLSYICYVMHLHCTCIIIHTCTCFSLWHMYVVQLMYACYLIGFIENILFHHPYDIVIRCFGFKVGLIAIALIIQLEYEQRFSQIISYLSHSLTSLHSMLQLSVSEQLLMASSPAFSRTTRQLE